MPLFNLGALYAVQQGGVPPYTYSWSNGATTKDLSAINKGTYTVTVTDAASATVANTHTVGYGVLWQNVSLATTTPNTTSDSSAYCAGVKAETSSDASSCRMPRCSSPVHRIPISAKGS